MGVTDFGTNAGATYNYKAKTFQSWANFTALSLPTSPIGCFAAATKCMTIQQNLVAYNVFEKGIAGVYWVQDVPAVAQIGTKYVINQLDNIWNFSAAYAPPNPRMGGVIYPNLLSKCSQDGGQPTYYYCEGSSKGISTTLPFEIRMTTTSGILASGAHKGSSYVELGIWVYHSGKLVGGGNFDEVAFNGAASSNPYYFVSGKGTNPYGTAIDAETVLCGPGGGSTIAISSVKATLSESYIPLGSNTLTQISHAWSGGYDTAETVSKVSMSSTVVGTGIASSGTDNNKQLW